MNELEKLTLEQRRERLQEALASQMTPGMRVEAQTDLSASIVFANGLRRVFTVGPDGAVTHQDFASLSAPDAATQRASKSGLGRTLGRLVLFGVGAFALLFLFYLGKGEAERQQLGVSEDNPWFTMRSRDDAIEITIRNGAETLRDARVTINDRWVCDLGTMRRGAPVVVLKRTCVSDDGLAMPTAIRAVSVSVRSDPDRYIHTQTFKR